MASRGAPLEFLLNGRPVRIDPAGPHTTLLDFLRARGLTGAKEGCAEGECGACTVLMVGDHDGGSAFQPINSCLMLVPTVAHREIYTIEALAAKGTLAEAQRAMAAAGGSQCGYCTPGFVMASAGLLRRNPNPSEPEIREALGSNICRCTGYVKIIEAVQHASALLASGEARSP
jgi:xanthine dehydrogenase small subunit